MATTQTSNDPYTQWLDAAVAMEGNLPLSGRRWVGLALTVLVAIVLVSVSLG